MFGELARNLRQGGLIGFHGISSRAAVYMDIDKSRSQDQILKIQSPTLRKFRGMARRERRDVPIFYDHHRRLNPFNRSNQARGSNDCGHEVDSAQSCLHVLRYGCKHKATAQFLVAV
jgi:hypothetical protein